MRNLVHTFADHLGQLGDELGAFLQGKAPSRSAPRPLPEALKGKTADDLIWLESRAKDCRSAAALTIDLWSELEWTREALFSGVIDDCRP